MPLVHCQQREVCITVKIPPASGSNSGPVYGEHCKTIFYNCRDADGAQVREDFEPVVRIDWPSLDMRQRAWLDRYAENIIANPRNRGTISTITSKKQKTMKYITHADLVAHRRRCASDTERLFRRYLRSRGGDPQNKASCRAMCRDLLLSPETLAVLTGGNRSVNFVAVLPAGGLPAGASIELSLIVNNAPAVYAPLGVSSTLCIADFRVSGAVPAGGGPPAPVDADDLTLEILVNGQVREDFAGGLVRSASNCNTLCGRCFCVGALEVFTVRVTNTSAVAIPAGTIIRLQTKRWFPGETGYICPGCGQCPTKKGGCGCNKKPPLTHYPADVDIDINPGADVDIDINYDTTEEDD